jgi:hypothetical protein
MFFASLQGPKYEFIPLKSVDRCQEGKYIMSHLP